MNIYECAYIEKYLTDHLALNWPQWMGCERSDHKYIINSILSQLD